MAVDDARWVEARRLYSSGGLTQSAIASKVGVSIGQLRRRAKAEGWKRTARAAGRSSMGGGKGTRSETRRGPAAGETMTDGNVRASVANRLYRAIDTKLNRLEARMHSGETLSPADSERETRELGTMVRSFEKLTELAAESDAPRGQAAERRQLITAEDAERMRREIAERLERLAQGGVARSRPGEAG